MSRWQKLISRFTFNGTNNNKSNRTWNRLNVMKRKNKSIQNTEINDESKIKPIRFRRTKRVFYAIGYNLRVSTWKMRFKILKYHTLHHFLQFVVFGFVAIRLTAYLLFRDCEAKNIPAFKPHKSDDQNNLSRAQL